MQARWFLSQFATDGTLGIQVPVCSAYGGQYLCPTHPGTTDGWALVLMLCDPHQAEAAAQDSRVLVLPQIYDTSALPQAVTDAYTSWGATTGMSLSALLVQLAKSEPIFANSAIT
jgi:hypothetical protein